MEVAGANSIRRVRGVSLGGKGAFAEVSGVIRRRFAGVAQNMRGTVANFCGALSGNRFFAPAIFAGVFDF